MATPALPADKFDTKTVFTRPENAPTRAPLDKLAVLPGFNTRIKDDDYNERVANIAASIAEHGFYEDKPLAVTMIEGDDTIYIFDGEHRFDASRAAVLDGAEFAEGIPIAWAKDGATVKDLTVHLLHGNNSERLNMVEMASVVRRLQALDMTKDEIAKEIGRTTRHVENLFVLADSNQEVRKAVAAGKIAGAEAVKLLRKDKASAPAKIKEAIRVAEEKGKAKATPKKTMTETPKGPKMKVIELEQSVPEGETMGAVLKALAGKLREHVKIGDNDILSETGMIRVKLHVIDHEAEAAAAKAAEEKAAAAAKREEEKAAAAKARADAKAEKDAKAAAAKQATTKALEAAAKKAGTDAAEAKAPEKAKPARRTARPKKDAPAAEGTSAPATASEAPSAPESGGDGNNGL
jgi:ParB/RepB/Spo0J family partition protein